MKRGEQEVRQFGAAMLHQLDRNSYKGDWKESTVEDSIWNVFYHALKLVVAAKRSDTDPIEVQEFGADVGNESMILCDLLSSLDAIYMSDKPVVLKMDDWDPFEKLLFEMEDLLKRHGFLQPGYEPIPPSERAKGAPQ